MFFSNFKHLTNFQITLGRPFGVAMLFAGVDVTGAQLFHLDPSGTFTSYRAKAIGAASDGAEQTLRDQYKEVWKWEMGAKMCIRQTIFENVKKNVIKPKKYI
jgi:20S proteasome alpha/beta subunit